MTKREMSIVFNGERVRLVPLGLRHLDDIWRGWNNPELKILLNGVIPDAYESEEEWIRQQIRLMEQRKNFVFVIERIEDDEFLGLCGLHSINWMSRSAELGVAIHDPQNWSKGYGGEALRLLIDFGWRHLNLRRIALSVYAFNERAVHLYQKLGFKIYGTAHEANFIDGRYVDIHKMELFREPRD